MVPCKAQPASPCLVVLQVASWEKLNLFRLVRVASDYNSVYLNTNSLMCANLSCGSVVEAALKVCRGEMANAVAVVRPPGHHAEEGEAMGFCIYNNVAVAAAAALELPEVHRVLIVDWDVYVQSVQWSWARAWATGGTTVVVVTRPASACVAHATGTMATARSTCSTTTPTCCTSPSTATTTACSTPAAPTPRGPRLAPVVVSAAPPSGDAPPSGAPGCGLLV